LLVLPQAKDLSAGFEDLGLCIFKAGILVVSEPGSGSSSLSVSDGC